jgi:hypothetical protein
VWKANYAAPQSAAWHSSLSPVLASLDLFDPDYRTSQEVTTDLYLINDSWHDASIHVDLLLTRECPEYIPEARCFERPVNKWSLNFVLKADCVRQVPVTWQLPAEEGCCWLSARLTGVKGRPVLSQRFVRAIRPPAVSDTARQLTFVVPSGSDGARAFFRRWGLRTSKRLDDLDLDTHVVVIRHATRLTESEKRSTPALCEFASRGGLVIVLATPSWHWPDLCDLKIRREPRFSRVFPSTALTNSPLEGIDHRWLVRWNDFPGTVAVGSLEGDVLIRADRILWAREPKTTVMARVPAASGYGRILFSQLDLQGRHDRSQPGYDPAAERILLRLLGVEIFSRERHGQSGQHARG